ncbi:MAG: DUF934 domain-containing protein [Deltaproteobacteria bacterium]|nr:DUF934 domain-containing protein [Deltaproteobacteria bacterium]
MRDVFDLIREPGAANARAASASEVVLSASGVEPRRWRVVADADAPADPGTIVPLARWLTLADEGADLTRVGVAVEPDADIGPLRAHLGAIPVVAVHYPRFGDGRGYSHARRLRHMWGYRGELLAFGDVLRDQLVWMWRVGIDRFHLRADQDPVASQRAFTLYSAFYQY